MSTVADYLAAHYAELAKRGPKRAGVAWESDTRRYRDLGTGRYIAERTITAKLDKYNDAVAEHMRRETERFIAGQIDLATWQQGVAKDLKDAYIVNLQIGRGGVNVTTFADYGREGGRLNFEYRRLNQFAQEIALGNLSDKQIAARLELYIPGIRTAYYDGKTAAGQAAGLTEERRVLSPVENCDDCVGYADQGWVPIGTLPEPGTQSACMHNCQCEKEYR